LPTTPTSIPHLKNRPEEGTAELRSVVGTSGHPGVDH